MELIAMDDLEERRLYELKSRNLVVGVWVPAREGFIGLREKFGDRYLFTEHHRRYGLLEVGRDCGTVDAMSPLDEMVPEDIELVEHFLVGEAEDRHWATNMELFEILDAWDKRLYNTWLPN